MDVSWDENKNRQNVKKHLLDFADASEVLDAPHFVYEDNGPGIQEQYWNKVFKMFETLDNTGNNNTGIGLTTVKSIIKRLGGKIELKHREEYKKGVCFHFNLSKRESN